MDTLPPRNSTDFPQSLTEAIKDLPDADNVLRLHQIIPTEYIKGNPKSRGGLIYHKMGSGKTWIGADLAYSLGKRGYKVIFLSSKSLHENAKKGLKEYLRVVEPGFTEDQIDNITKTKYSFVSTKNRATVRKTLEGAIKGHESEGVFGEEVQGTKLDNTLLIIDEAHNMFNGIINGSKSDLELYDLIMNARNIKIILLTGSPIINTPAELMPVFNMLSGTKLFGESYGDFMKSFVDTKYGRIKNKAKFQNRIFGLVSYYSAKGYEKYFPEEKPMVVEHIHMSSKQYAAYGVERDKEIEQAARTYISKGRPQRMSRSSGKSSSTYRIQTRQISNIFYPERAMPKGKRNSDLLTKEDLVDRINVVSPKFHKMWCNIQELPSHGVVYSQFVESGVGAFGKMLEYRGYTRIRSATDLVSANKKKDYRGFAILYGGADPEERNLIMEVYNSPENIRGGIMHLLLITATAVEGTDLKAGRHLHMMEPYWNWARTLQFGARLRRYKSHEMLPPAERNIQMFIYLSDYPKGLPDSRKNGLTTDVELYESARMNQRIINSFLKALREVSMDCTIHTSEENCRSCMPTSEKLFIDDMLQDLKTKDSCVPVTTKKIKAKEIKTDLGTFYYTIDDDIHIFEKSKQLGGIVEIFGDHPYYDDLYTKIRGST